MFEIITAVAGLLVVLGLASGWLQRTPVTGPMIALGAGVVLGPGLGVLPTDLDNTGVLLLAELTLATLLFVDATRIDLRLARHSGQVPARMLLLGLPATIALGTVAGVAVLGLGASAAFVLACVLAPTDAALGQPVMTDHRVPHRVRQALNVESGLNDGLAAPFLAVALVVAGAPSAGGGGSVAIEVARLVGLGLLVGAGIGGAVGAAVKAIDWRTLQPAPRQVGAAGVPLLTYGVAELVGGNGFVAAFVAGLMFGAQVRDARDLVEYGEDTGELLSLITFLVFGAVFIGPATEAVSIRVVAYIALSLTVVRMLPIAASLAGMHLHAPTLGMLGWFGPRGLATVVFGLEVLELAHAGYGPGEDLFGVAALVVVSSVVLHGLSARPFAGAYARALQQRAQPGTAEFDDVDEVPMRRSAQRRTSA